VIASSYNVKLTKLNKPRQNGRKITSFRGSRPSWDLCICMHINLYTHACGCTYALVKAHFVYLYCPISVLHARVYHRCFLILTCVCVKGLEVKFVSACSWLALVTSMGGYVLVGVEIGILSCIFLYFCGY